MRRGRRLGRCRLQSTFFDALYTSAFDGLTALTPSPSTSSSPSSEASSCPKKNFTAASKILGLSCSAALAAHTHDSLATGQTVCLSQEPAQHASYTPRWICRCLLMPPELIPECGGHRGCTYDIGSAGIAPDLAPPQLCQDSQCRLCSSFPLVGQTAIQEVLQ